MKDFVTLIKGDKIGIETDYRDYLPINMTGVLKPLMGASGYMIQFPGITQHGTTVGADRGGIWNERASNHYRVSGSSFVSISTVGISSTLGSVTGSGLVSLPYSFNTQGIVAGGRFYLYDTTVGFREVTDPDLGNPIDCVWVDGYYFFTDGEYIYHTDLADESAIDPLKFATAEFMPDPSLGLGKTSDNKVMVFGRYTIEYFVNVASANFAFQRRADRAIKAGIVGTHCKAELNSRWYILGGPKEGGISVHRVGVGSVEPIATREVDKVIGQYSETDLSASKLEAYSEDGYSYLIVHLPNDVLIYNETLAMKAGIDFAWSILRTGTESDKWRGINLVFDPRIGKWTLGDKGDSKLGLLDNTESLQYGDIAEWQLATPFINIENSSVDSLEIQTAPGHTITDDATVFISLTYNGVTYGKEWSEMYGEPSDYGKRFIIRRLGYVDDFIGIKLRGATRSRMAFAGATIDYG